MTSNTLATHGDVSLSADEFLGWLRRRRKLQSLLVSALIEKRLLTEARKMGATVSDEELQQAADDFRQRNALSSAKKTQVWLDEEGLSVADFEDSIEIELLIAKVKQHSTSEQINDYFEQHRRDFDQLVLRQIIVAREDLARELLTQIKEEGQDFAELANEHSILADEGGLLDKVARHELVPEIAEAIATAQPSDVVGPIESEEGFHLFLVEEVAPAPLDEATSDQIRQHLFDIWVDELLKQTPVTLSYRDRP